MDLLANLRSRLPSRQSRLDLSGIQTSMDGLQLLDQAGFLIAEIDRSGLIQSANSRLCRMRGAELNDVLGTGLPYLVNAVERSAVSDLIHTVFAGHDGGVVVARLLTTNGARTSTIRWALIPLSDEDGSIASALCLGTDLTAHIAVPAPPEPDPEPEDSAELEALRDEAQRIEKENKRLQKELKQLAAAPPAGPPPPVPDHLSEAGDDTAVTLAELERRHVFHTLKDTRGRVSGPKGAAARLGLHPNTLRSRMEKLGIGKVG